MARKKKDNDKGKCDNFLTVKQNILDVDIYDYSLQLMLIYGSNILAARCIADVRDGLLPVERRILYTMYKDLKMKPGKQYKKKVSQIQGMVTGKYHPHGDMSVVDSICKLGQWWKTPIPIIKKDGNYGNSRGDNHAAQRYIEGNLSNFAYDLYFKNWTDNITEFMSNYSGDDVEPEYLQSAFPILLCKQIFGLAWGGSTNIPYYNLGEVADLTIKLIDNPDLKDIYLIPDSPFDCYIYDTDWVEICNTGTGKYRLIGDYEIEDNNIVITKLPHGVNIYDLIDTITGMVKDKKMPGIYDIVDESTEYDKEDDGVNRCDIRLVIKLNKGFSPDMIMRQIKKSTNYSMPCQIKFDIVYDYSNLHVSLRSILLNWIEFRRETKRKVYSFKYSKLKRSIHLNEAIIKILSSEKGDTKFIKIVRKSKNRKNLIEQLVDTFKISDIQAETISDMKMYNLSIEHMQSYIDELKALEKEATGIKAYLLDEDMIDKEIKDELKYFKSEYNVPRRAVVIQDTEKNISEYNCYITITDEGDIYKTKEPIQIENSKMLEVNNVDSVLLFSDNGLVSNLEVNSIELTGHKSPYNISKVIGKSKFKNLVSITRTCTEDELKIAKKPIYLVFVTKNGVIKKTLFKNYSSVTKTPVISINLKNDDELVKVLQLEGDDNEILIYSKKGNYVKYSIADIPETLRTTKGVIGMRLDQLDNVCDMIPLTKRDYLFILTNKGKGKKCLCRMFDKMKRADNPLILNKCDGNEYIVAVKSIKEKNNVKIVTTSDEYVVDKIPEKIKMSSGDKLVKLKKSEQIVRVEII